MQEQTKENKLPVVLLAVIIVVLLVGSIVIGIFGGGGKQDWHCASYDHPQKGTAY